MSVATDKRCVVANVHGDLVFRRGAKVVVGWCSWAGGGFERVHCRGISLSGRRVERWIPAKWLFNVRTATLPQEHPDYEFALDCGRYANAAEQIARWGDSLDTTPPGGVRF